MEENKKNIFNFFELLDSKEKIEIPIIQRDYAQGREDKSEIRNNFLSALEHSISNSSPIQLDFIYGSKVDESFQPLDGQQRLTTLFLLHWYALSKENYSLELRNKLKGFSYETRITSREFCQALVENPFIVESNARLSEQIRDSKWFFLSWNKDPTIDAMLRTIDDINLKFSNIDNLWDKLTTKNLVSFYYVELDEIGLTDDLYIKMNARGKLLSSFENFKASFEKQIEDNGWEQNKEQLDKFAFKIDTDWTDFFWKYFRKNNTIDNSLMKFMSTIVMIRTSIERKPDRISLISQLNDDYNSLKPSYISEKTFDYIYQCFNFYCNLDNLDILNIDLPFFRHKPQNNFFDEVVNMGTSSSYTQKVYFYALTEYLLRNHEIDNDRLLDWMRVIRNILSRGSIEKGGNRPDIIRSPETFDGVINLITELSEGCSNIYEFLNNKRPSSFFAKDQIEEELVKAKIILYNDDFKSAICHMEDLTFFKGRISFALNCIEYKNIPDNFELELFNKVNAVIRKYFDDDNNDKVSNDIRRALLTIEVNGQYNFYEYWKSYWYAIDANKRCLIDNYRELEYYIYNTTEYSDYLKKLILKLTEKDILQIIDEFSPPENMPNWKIRLIKENDLLDKKSKSNYIAISPDDTFCYLLKSKRPRDTKGCNKIM